MKYSFSPISDKESTILILGSLPGEESLKQQQYYAHNRNLFWKIMFDILKAAPTTDYNRKCQLLLDNHIALWDMVHRGNRIGSLDSNIKNEEVNNLNSFLKEHTKINKILLNGKKAEALFKKQFSNIDIPTITLPSTSPANARMSYEEKLGLWKSAILD